MATDPESDLRPSGAEGRPTGFYYVLAQVDLALRPRFDALCAAHGLTLSQYTALAFLERRPGLTSSELARRTFVRPQSMATTMAPLIELGFVRREVDREHRRRMRMFLTERGIEVAQRLAAEVVEIEAEMLHDFSPAERAGLLSAMRRVRDAARTAWGESRAESPD